MAEFSVRKMYQGQDAGRREIVDAATRELRRTYGPRNDNDQCGVLSSETLVAVHGNLVIGTADYVHKGDCLYVQGLAVHPEYRRHGVCRALISAAEAIAKKEKLAALALCAIEETGNVLVFKKLGFEITSRAIAPNHVSPAGRAVIQVEMERRNA